MESKEKFILTGKSACPEKCTAPVKERQGLCAGLKRFSFNGKYVQISAYDRDSLCPKLFQHDLGIVVFCA
jgi:hypothetical protein